jgi:hypothetical protein
VKEAAAPEGKKAGCRASERASCRRRRRGADGYARALFSLSRREFFFSSLGLPPLPPHSNPATSSVLPSHHRTFPQKSRRQGESKKSALTTTPHSTTTLQLLHSLPLSPRRAGSPHAASGTRQDDDQGPDKHQNRAAHRAGEADADDWKKKRERQMLRCGRPSEKRKRLPLSLLSVLLFALALSASFDAVKAASSRPLDPMRSARIDAAEGRGRGRARAPKQRTTKQRKRGQKIGPVPAARRPPSARSPRPKKLPPPEHQQQPNTNKHSACAPWPPGPRPPGS